MMQVFGFAYLKDLENDDECELFTNVKHSVLCMLGSCLGNLKVKV